MNKCPWEIIKAFQSPEEFERFEHWIAQQIAFKKAIEVAVNPKLRGPYWRQRWFRHELSGQIWRLAEPDPPFTGTFEPLSSSPKRGRFHYFANLVP